MSEKNHPLLSPLLSSAKVPSYLEKSFLCYEKMICLHLQTLMSILKSFVFPGILKVLLIYVYEGITQIL